MKRQGSEGGTRLRGQPAWRVRRRGSAPVIHGSSGSPPPPLTATLPHLPQKMSPPLPGDRPAGDLMKRMQSWAVGSQSEQVGLYSFDRRAGNIELSSSLSNTLSDQLEEALGREHQELRVLLQTWERRVERRKQEHVRQQKEILQRMLREHAPVQSGVQSEPRSTPHYRSRGSVENDAEREKADVGSAFTSEAQDQNRAPDLGCDTDATQKTDVAQKADLEAKLSCTLTQPLEQSDPNELPAEKTAPAPPDVDSAAQEVEKALSSSSNDSDSTVLEKKKRTSAWLKNSPSAVVGCHTSRGPMYPSSWRRYVKPDTPASRSRNNFHIVARISDRMSTLQYVTKSRMYEWLSAMLIVLNGLFIGYQTDWIAGAAAELAGQGLSPLVNEPPSFVVLQGLFSVAFAAELCLRWAADGALKFFQTQDCWWNMFDVFVVVLSIMDFVITLVEQAATGGNSVMGNISVLRVARVIRIIRVARVIRVMRFFRELRMMIYSILGSLKALVWSVAVLLLMFFIFGISLTLGTVYHLDTVEVWQSDSTKMLRSSFGSLPRSILSLYMAMSGGRNWGEFYDTLSDVSGAYALLFVFFVTVAIFAVGNVVTGIFVENALESNQTDKEVLVQDELDAKRAYFFHMQEVFEELDDDTDGVITVDEFERKLDDERVIAYFNVLNLDVSDARMLFTLLDYDQSGEVAIEEFLAGCNKLKGESRSLDLAIMQMEIRWLKEAFLGFADFMESTVTKKGGVATDSPGRRGRRSSTVP